MKQQYRISEIADKAQVSKRTVHYYIARGLLPSPEGSGLGTYYTEDHFYRLLLIRRWQAQFLPLEEIRNRISPLSLEEVKKELAKRVDVLPLPVPVPPPCKAIGSRYQRVVLHQDLELHFSEDNPEAKKLAEQVLIWFSNQKKEG